MDRLKKYQWKKVTLPQHFESPFDKTGSYLLPIFNNVKELNNIFPYSRKRMFCTCAGESKSIERGNHAHFATYELLLVLQGSVSISLDNTIKAEKIELTVGHGLIIGPNVWRILDNTSPNNVNLFLCSTELNKDDYIHDYTDFKEYMLLNAN